VVFKIHPPHFLSSYKRKVIKMDCVYRILLIGNIMPNQCSVSRGYTEPTGLRFVILVKTSIHLRSGDASTVDCGLHHNDERLLLVDKIMAVLFFVFVILVKTSIHLRSGDASTVDCGLHHNDERLLLVDKIMAVLFFV